MGDKIYTRPEKEETGEKSIKALLEDDNITGDGITKEELDDLLRIVEEGTPQQKQPKKLR